MQAAMPAAMPSGRPHLRSAASCLARCVTAHEQAPFAKSQWRSRAPGLPLQPRGCFVEGIFSCRIVLPPWCHYPAARSLLEVDGAWPGCAHAVSPVRLAGDALGGAGSLTSGSLKSSTMQRRSCFVWGGPADGNKKINLSQESNPSASASSPSLSEVAPQQQQLMMMLTSP